MLARQDSKELKNYQFIPEKSPLSDLPGS